MKKKKTITAAVDYVMDQTRPSRTIIDMTIVLQDQKLDSILTKAGVLRQEIRQQVLAAVETVLMKSMLEVAC